MGLSLKRQTAPDVEPSERIEVGSYGSIHKFRKILALLTARHYLGEGKLDIAEEAMNFFPGIEPEDWHENGRARIMAWANNGSSLSDLFNAKTDYEFVSDTVRDERLEGLRKFINHSDSDGRHSRGDVFDIAALFETLSPDAEAVLTPEEHSRWLDIGSFFLAARDGHEFITYC